MSNPAAAEEGGPPPHSLRSCQTAEPYLCSRPIRGGTRIAWEHVRHGDPTGILRPLLTREGLYSYHGSQGVRKAMADYITSPGGGDEPLASAQSWRIALTLQGGGALGAYQAGVFQTMEEAGIAPEWISGTSVGAITGAIIAGSPPWTGHRTSARVLATRGRLGDRRVGRHVDPQPPMGKPGECLAVNDDSTPWLLYPSHAALRLRKRFRSCEPV